MIFGELDIVLFDDNGRPTRLISMGDLASGKTLVYRQSSPIWHSVIIRSEYAAIHEVTNGPFRVEENEFAPWSPEEDRRAARFSGRCGAGFAGAASARGKAGVSRRADARYALRALDSGAQPDK